MELDELVGTNSCYILFMMMKGCELERRFAIVFRGMSSECAVENRQLCQVKFK